MPTVHHQNMTFVVEPEVYEPAEDTFLLACNLDVRESEHVLELGTGCGLIAILAAKAGARVLATDVNPTALRCARNNARAHNVEKRIEFRLGDLFEPVNDERFDLIIFNPPYLPVSHEEELSTPLDRAWEGGPDGRTVIDRFLDELPQHLGPRGRVLLVQSSLSNVKKTVRQLEEKGFAVEIVSKKLPFEELSLFRARRFLDQRKH
ncbi:MAG: HemK2/MTQ2 family protein methyltransferase [Candidatus Hadarchaeota archaeon]|nr:HemK2/MTQ2 family protein methyltransferase [Candidatus Hadarchaeota archaeon]